MRSGTVFNQVLQSFWRRGRDVRQYSNNLYGVVIQTTIYIQLLPTCLAPTSKLISKSEQTSPFSKLESFQTLTHWSTIPGSFMVFSKGERSYQGEKPHSWLMLTGQYHCQVWCSRLLAALACARKLYVYTFASFSWGKRASNLWLSPQKMNATSRRQALLNDEWVLAVNSGTDVKCRGCQRVIRLGKPYELGETSEQLSSDHRKEENPCCSEEIRRRKLEGSIALSRCTWN